MLISLAVTAMLICVFVFAYEKSQFSHDAANYYNNRDCKINIVQMDLIQEPLNHLSLIIGYAYAVCFDISNAFCIGF